MPLSLQSSEKGIEVNNAERRTSGDPLPSRGGKSHVCLSHICRRRRESRADSFVLKCGSGFVAQRTGVANFSMPNTRRLTVDIWRLLYLKEAGQKKHGLPRLPYGTILVGDTMAWES